MLIALLCSAALAAEEPATTPERETAPSPETPTAAPEPAPKPEATGTTQPAPPSEAPAPERTTHVSMRTSVSGTNGSLGLVTLVEGGVAIEHRLGEVTSIGIGFNVAVVGTASAPTGGLLGSTGNYLALLFEPTVRRWLGGATPLDGLFFGVSVPLSHHRQLRGPESFSWQVGLYGQLGYSLLLAKGLVIQAAIGPGGMVNWGKSTGLGGLTPGTSSSSAETITYAIGFRSNLSFGYAF